MNQSNSDDNGSVWPPPIPAPPGAVAPPAQLTPDLTLAGKLASVIVGLLSGFFSQFIPFYTGGDVISSQSAGSTSMFWQLTALFLVIIAAQIFCVVRIWRRNPWFAAAFALGAVICIVCVVLLAT